MIGRKIVTLVGLGMVVGTMYTKHTYNQLIKSIALKLYKGEELDEQEKALMESNIKLQEALKNKKIAEETIDNIVEANK